MGSFEIVTGTYEEFLLGYIFNPFELKLTQSFASHDHTSSIRCLDSSDRYLASGGTDDRIIVYDMKTRKQHSVLDHHTATISTVEFTPNASHLISGSSDGVLTIIKTGNWKIEKVWAEAHKGAVLDVAVHPSGKLALSLGQDAILRTWNLVKGRDAYIVNLKSKSKDPRSLEMVTWCKDTVKFFLSGGKYAEIWSSEIGGILKVIEYSSRVTSCIWFSNDQILTGHEDGYITLVGVSDDSKKPVKAHDGRVKAMVRHSDYIISASSTGEIKVWDLHFDEIARVKTGCRITCVCVVPMVHIKKEKEEVKEEEQCDIIDVSKAGSSVVVEVEDESAVNRMIKKKKKHKVKHETQTDNDNENITVDVKEEDQKEEKYNENIKLNGSIEKKEHKNKKKKEKLIPNGTQDINNTEHKFDVNVDTKSNLKKKKKHRSIIENNLDGEESEECKIVVKKEEKRKEKQNNNKTSFDCDDTVETSREEEKGKKKNKKDKKLLENNITIGAQLLAESSLCNEDQIMNGLGNNDKQTKKKKDKFSFINTSYNGVDELGEAAEADDSYVKKKKKSKEIDNNNFQDAANNKIVENSYSNENQTKKKKKKENSSVNISYNDTTDSDGSYIKKTKELDNECYSVNIEDAVDMKILKEGQILNETASNKQKKKKKEKYSFINISSNEINTFDEMTEADGSSVKKKKKKSKELESEHDINFVNVADKKILEISLPVDGTGSNDKQTKKKKKEKYNPISDTSCELDNRGETDSLYLKKKKRKSKELENMHHSVNAGDAAELEGLDVKQKNKKKSKYGNLETEQSGLEIESNNLGEVVEVKGSISKVKKRKIHSTGSILEGFDMTHSTPVNSKKKKIKECFT